MLSIHTYDINFFEYLVYFFFLSIFLNTLILKIKKFNQKQYHQNSEKPQNIHSHEVSRIGGITIFLTLMFESLFILKFEINLLASIFISSIPTFATGFYEDLTGIVKPKVRLISSFVTGIIFILITSTLIKFVGVDFVDYLLSFKLISIFLTILAISAVINAFNIIDGLNGLSLGSAIIMLLSMLYLSSEIDNVMLQNSILFILIPILTIFFFNFPFGNIFLGDGGAYLIGFLVAISSIMISQDNNIISPFGSLLIIAYPFYEMIRTIIRRKFIMNTKVMMPDAQHLHSLIYKYILKYYKKPTIYLNPLASLVTLSLPLFCCIWTILFYKDSTLIIIGLLLFLIFYEILAYKFSKM